MSAYSVKQSDACRSLLTDLSWGRVLGPLLSLGATLGTFVLFAVQGILLARLLGPELRGAFAAAILFPQTLLYLGLLGAPELFARYAAQGVENTSLRRSAARYGLLAGLISLGVCWLLDGVFIQAELRWVLPWACLCALVLPLQQIRLAVQAVDHGQREFRRFNQCRLLAAAAFPLALILAYTAGLTSFPQICIVFVISQTLALLLAQSGMRETWRGRSAVSMPAALRQARPLVASWFSSELLERLDMCLMLALVTDEATLGYYAAALPIASLLIIVPNTASLYAFNRGAREEEIPTAAVVWKMLVAGVVIQVASAAALAAVLPWLVPFFYGEAFAPTVTFAWWLLPAGMFRGLLQAVDGYLRARGRAVVGVAARVAGIILLVAVSMLAGPWLAQWNIPPAHAIPLGLSLALGFCFCVLSAAVLVDVTIHHGRRERLASGLS